MTEVNMPDTGGGSGDAQDRHRRSVYDTGVTCEEDGTFNLRVKDVDTLYQTKEVNIPAPKPYATRSVKHPPPGFESERTAPTQPCMQSRKGNKRKNHRGQDQQIWTKKIVRTTSASGEEQETISMYLRSADTVIDLSIKSPAKKKTSRRHQRHTDSATSSGPSEAGTLHCSNSSQTLQVLQQSRSIRHKEADEIKGGESDKTELVGSTAMRTEHEVARRSLHKLLEAQELPCVPQKEATGSEGGEGFSFPGVDAETSQKKVVAFGSDNAGPSRPENIHATPDPAQEPKDVAGGTAVQGGTASAEEPTLCHFAEGDAEPVPTVERVTSDEGLQKDGGEGVDWGEAVPVLHEVNGTQNTECLVAQSNLPVNESGKSASVEARVNQTTPASTALEFPLSVPDLGSPPPPPSPIEFPLPDADTQCQTPRNKPKPCQLTVADCLAEFRSTRSRSPSPILPSPPQGTPSNLPLRHNNTRVQSSPPAMKLVQLSPNAAAATTGGEMTEGPKMYLDAILSKLSPLEQARYLRAKAEMLEEKLGATGPEQELTASKEKRDSSKSKGKSKMPKENPTTERTQPSKKELRRARRAAEKQAEMESIDKAMRDLEMKKALLEADCKKKKRNEVPSPRESSKGQPSKRTVQPREASKVSDLTVGRKKNSNSLDSSGLSLHSESNVINDLHSIGVWDTVREVPPCEVNEQGHPIGRFWKHMQSYTHDRAPWIFPWDIPWPSQDKALKRAFANRVQSLYPGKYDIDYVLEDVATNIRQRRQRTRNHMKKHNSKKFTPIAHGLTVKAWNNIWASISNRSYQEKSNKCKVAADARTERMGYTHRLGSLGVAGLIKKFEEEFKRVPTEEEVTIGKRDGIRSLFSMLHKRYNVRAGGENTVLAIQEAEPSKSPKKRPGRRASQDTDEDSARTSSDEEEEDNTRKHDSSSNSDSSKSVTSKEDGEDDGEEASAQIQGCGSELEETQREDVGSSSEDDSADDRD